MKCGHPCLINNFDRGTDEVITDIKNTIQTSWNSLTENSTLSKNKTNKNKKQQAKRGIFKTEF